MSEAAERKTGYAGWQKAVLIGCLVVALLGTLGVITMTVKISTTISSYGGSPNAAFFAAMVMMLLSVWLFAGSGALLVYNARLGRDIRDRLETLAAATRG